MLTSEKNVTELLKYKWKKEGWIVVKHTDVFLMGIPDIELKKDDTIVQCEIKISKNVKITDTLLDYGRKRNRLKGFITGPQVQFLKTWFRTSTPSGCLVVTPEGWIGVGAPDLELLWTQSLQAFGERFVRRPFDATVFPWPTVGDVHEAFLFRG